MRTDALTPVVTRGAMLALMLAVISAAAAAPKDVVIQKLSFRYVATPNADPPATVEIQDNAAVAAGKEEGAFWTDANVAPLQGMVRAVLRDDPELQRHVAAVLEITNKPIMVVLLDDVAAPLTATRAVAGGGTEAVATALWGACIDSGNHAWPCAGAHKEGSSFGGHMTLGASFFQSLDPTTARSIFLHELVHTQDRSDWRGHMFFVGGKSLSYGADGDHQQAEAIPNSAMTYAEGIANTLWILYDPAAANRHFNWWATNGVMWIERPPTGAPANVSWLYDAVKQAKPPVKEIEPIPVPPAPSASDPDAAEKRARREQIMQWNKSYAFFEIRSLPANLIMQNEFILALVFSEWARHVSEPKFMAALKKTNVRLTDVCASSVTILIEELAASSGTGTQRLVPLGFIDYFTGYQAKNEDEYAAIFDGLLSKERFITPYFAVRDKVKAAAPLDKGRNPEFGDLTSIAMALGVTSQSR